MDATQQTHKIRVGQRYVESGTPMTPDVMYVEVVSVDPLIVQPEAWTGRRGLDPRPYDPEALTRLPLERDPELTPTELRDYLVGRTIVAVEVSEPEGDWPQGSGDVTLTLDDGRTASFVSWGYDANGMDVHVAPPL